MSHHFSIIFSFLDVRFFFMILPVYNSKSVLVMMLEIQLVTLSFPKFSEQPNT